MLLAYSIIKNTCKYITKRVLSLYRSFIRLKTVFYFLNGSYLRYEPYHITRAINDNTTALTIITIVITITLL